jgi:hypothetical protein
MFRVHHRGDTQNVFTMRWILHCGSQLILILLLGPGTISMRALRWVGPFWNHGPLWNIMLA